MDEDRESEAPGTVSSPPFTITERPSLVARGLCGPASPGPAASSATELDHTYDSSCGVRVHLPPVRNSKSSDYGQGNGAGAAASAKAMAADADATADSKRECGCSNGSSGVGSESCEEENAYSELTETAATTNGKRRTRSGMIDSFRALLRRSHEGRPNENGEHVEEAPGAAVDVAAVVPKSPTAEYAQLQRRKESTGTQVEILDDSTWTPTPTPQFLADLELKFAANASASAAASSSAWGEGELSREGEYASPEEFLFPVYDIPRAPEQTAKCSGSTATGFASATAAPECVFSAAASAMKSGDKGVKPECLNRALSNNYAAAPAPGFVESCEEEDSAALYDELNTKTTEGPEPELEQEPNTYKNEDNLTRTSNSSVVHASAVPAASKAGAAATAVADAENLYDVPRSRRGDLPERPQLRAASASDGQSGNEKQAAVLQDDNAD